MLLSSLYFIAIFPLYTAAQSCAADCLSGCISFTTANTFCQFDYQGWDSKVSCQCQYPYHAIGSGSKAAGLGPCVACNDESVGGLGLAIYQYWFTICNAYAGAGGENAALSVAALPTQQVIDAYSASLLTLVESKYCGNAIVPTQSITPVTTFTKSQLSTLSSSPLPTQPSISRSTVTSSTSTSTATPQTNSGHRCTNDLKLIEWLAISVWACIGHGFAT